MTTSIDEAVVLYVENIEQDFYSDPENRKMRYQNHKEVLAANVQASEVELESLYEFFNLIYDVDPDYIDAAAHVPAPTPSEPLMNWQEVGQALAESQRMLQTMQNLLSLTLSELGVEDHASVRIYEDQDNKLRLVSDHPRHEEIETVLNSPKQRQLQELYRSATNGMSLAGCLIGNGALPEEVLQKVKSQIGAA